MCASRSPSARYKFHVHGAVKSRGMAVTATGSACGGTIENVYWHGCFLSMRDGVLIMRVMSRATIALATAGPFSVLFAGESVTDKIFCLFHRTRVQLQPGVIEESALSFCFASHTP